MPDTTPRLGDIAAVLRPYRDAGVSYSAVTYVAAQLWDDALSGDPNVTIGAQRSDLKARDNTITSLRVINADLEQRIAERDLTIAELRAELAAQPASDDIKVLRTHAFALVAEANGLRRRVAERDQHIAELRRRVADLEQRNRQLTAAAHNDRTDPMDGGRPADTIPRLTIPADRNITLQLPAGTALVIEATP